MEPEVIEISPPRKLKAKALKRKEVAYHEVIDVDMDEDVVLIQGNKKGKGAISLGPSSNAEQGSMHSAQTRNNKGKDGGVQMGENSKRFIDLDDYAFEDDGYSMPTTGIKADMKKNSSTCSGLHAKKNPGSCCSMGKDVENEDVVESFKRFDIVVDYSDHHYATKSSCERELAMARFRHYPPLPQPLLLPFFQPTKDWVKRIQNEWRILQQSLPDTIYVRAYESRMDLLRAVLIGAEGTPYHDGLFFFDLCFTSTYPLSPPLVYYHHKAHSSINRNINCKGRVCLSLLNTWGSRPEEMWVPGTSTVLQVLVSIQGLVFTAKPYFNLGLGYEERKKNNIPLYDFTVKSATQHHEYILTASLKTMVSTMEKPPKHFEDFVRGHFRKRARDILMACKAYTEGVAVGCVVRGGVQDLDEEAEFNNNNNSWSDKYKSHLVATVNTLVAAFNQIGAKEAHDFIYLLN